MKVFAREALVVVAIIIAAIVLFFALYGAASMLSAPPTITLTPTDASSFANWIQAVGSIIAIGGSFWIGHFQAKSAQTTAERIHAEDLAQRDREFDDSARRYKDADERREQQQQDEAWAAAAVTKILVTRLHKDVVGFTTEVDRAAQTYHKDVVSTDEATENLRKLIASRAPSWDQVKPKERLETATKTRDQALKSLLGTTPDAEKIIVRLNALPIANIRRLSPSLADYLVAAINHMHGALMEIEHSRNRADITSHMKAVDDALSDYIKTLNSMHSQLPKATD
ncbi:hypothetical protein ACOTF2_23015 [Achromobacter xylosoxidans]